MFEEINLKRISVVVDQGIAVVTLEDPERRNVLGDEMGAEIREVVRAIATSDVRVLVITGRGKAFCAGADLPELFGSPETPTPEMHTRLSHYYAAFLDIFNLAIPTIAAVNGPAVGAGLNLALACDFRIASPEAAMGATFSRIGLHPGGGASFFLSRRLGATRAMRMLLLGETLNASEALELGLADEVADDCVEAALAFAGQIAGVDPVLAQGIKRSVRLSEPANLTAVLAHETWAQATSAASPEVQVWVDRFRSKR